MHWILDLEFGVVWVNCCFGQLQKGVGVDLGNGKIHIGWVFVSGGGGQRGCSWLAVGWRCLGVAALS